MTPVVQQAGEPTALSCPFCGSNDISDGEILGGALDETEADYTQSECRECGAVGPRGHLNPGEIDYGSVKAIAAWNRRASRPQQPQAETPLTEPGLRDALERIADMKPRLEDSTHGPRWRCQQCGYAWVNGKEMEAHLIGCGFSIARAALAAHPPNTGTPPAETPLTDERLSFDVARITPELHPATRNLVARFSMALAEKLLAAEKKYGYEAGWIRSDWLDECRQHLREHIEKGDPRDVAAYCAFLWHHGASTAHPNTETQPQAETPLTDVRITSWPTLRRYSDAIRALKALLNDPHGCQFCDSGKLRNKAKPHDDECGFELARVALTKEPATLSDEQIRVLYHASMYRLPGRSPELRLDEIKFARALLAHPNTGAHPPEAEPKQSRVLYADEPLSEQSYTPLPLPPEAQEPKT